MIIKNINSKWINNIVILSADIKSDILDNKYLSLWFKIEGINKLPCESGDPFLVAFLLPCMYYQEDLKIYAPVSNSLLANISKVQNIMTNWYPELKKIKISSPIFYDSHLKNNKNSVGCFFSGGVDSLYTLLKHQKEISNLILVHGFDIDLDNEKLWLKTLDGVQIIAKELNKKIITVKSNIRELTDKRYARRWKKHHDSNGGSWWASILYGSSLASVGLCLQAELDLAFIACSGTPYEKLTPWGSHPDLDKFWSTKKLEFRHDEIETRMNKIKYLSKYPSFLRNLRVCYSKNIKNINCGLCEKCIRTYLALKLSGVKLPSDIFDYTPDIKHIRTCRFKRNSSAYLLWEQMLEEAFLQEETELYSAIAIALEKKFSFYRWSIIILYHNKSVLLRLCHKKIRRFLPQSLRKKIKSLNWLKS
jgi:hypothetical protein